MTQKTVTLRWEEGPAGTEGEPDFEPAVLNGQRRIVVHTAVGSPGENGYPVYIPDTDLAAASTVAGLWDMWGPPPEPG